MRQKFIPSAFVLAIVLAMGHPVQGQDTLRTGARVVKPRQQRR